MTIHETSETPLRAEGPKPIDFVLPSEGRARVYLFAIAVFLGIAIFVLIGGLIKFAETGGSISNVSDASASTENLLPPAGAGS